MQWIRGHRRARELTVVVVTMDIMHYQKGTDCNDSGNLPFRAYSIRNA